MLTSVAQAVYLAAAVLFILSLAGLSKQETARRGNVAGMVGMALALVATVALALQRSERPVAVTGVADPRRAPRRRDRRHVAGASGRDDADARAHRDPALVRRARRGARRLQLVPHRAVADPAHLVEVFLGVLIGAVTFTGSIVAYLKLSTADPLGAAGAARPQLAQPRHGRGVGRPAGVVPGHAASVLPLLLMTVVALALGWHLVASIGGGDMPVVVSMLNSYSGLGGRRGGLHAQQRPAHRHRRARRLLRCDPQLPHVHGDEPVVRQRHPRRVRHRGRDRRRGRRRPAASSTRSCRPRSAELLADARTVVITPGYGMAVAKAQYPVAELVAQAARPRASTCGSASTPSRAGSPAT